MGSRFESLVSFLAEQSDPSTNRWFWSYHVRIENGSEIGVQLLSRSWRIVDGRGTVHEVLGEGVVGEMPLIAPGASFDYVSGCPLDTPSGAMSGSTGWSMKTAAPSTWRFPGSSCSVCREKRSWTVKSSSQPTANGTSSSFDRASSAVFVWLAMSRSSLRRPMPPSSIACGNWVLSVSEFASTRSGLNPFADLKLPRELQKAP